MVDIHTQHPTAEQLRAFILGKLTAEEHDRVEEHVGGCDSCCEALGSIPDDTLINQVKNADTSIAETLASVGAQTRTETNDCVPGDLASHSRYRVVRQLGRRRFRTRRAAVLDLTEEFYLETVERIFQRAELAEGNFTYRGRKVDPGAIRNTALLTVEGGRDDICALGQTAAAHELCSSLRPHLKRHHLQANVGHYGVFSGKRWEKEIYPIVRNMILSME